MIRRGPAGAIAPMPDTSVRLIRILAVTVFLEWLGATPSCRCCRSTSVSSAGRTVGRPCHGLVLRRRCALPVPGGPSVRPARSQTRARRRAHRVLARQLRLPAPHRPGDGNPAARPPGPGRRCLAVAALAMVSGAVAVERRGRAFASIYGAQISGMAVGPLIGAIVGVHNMWPCSSAPASSASSRACPRCASSSRPRRRRGGAIAPRPTGRSLPGPRAVEPLDGRRHGGCRRPRPHHRDLRHLLDLLMVSRGAAGWEIGVSWTLFAVPFVVAARPSGWLADHMDRRYLVLGASASPWSSAPPIRSSRWSRS